MAEHPLTRTVVFDAAVCAAWLLWAGLLITVIVGVLRRVARAVRRGVRLPPLPTPLQATASGLMGATLLHPAHSGPPAPPPAPPAMPAATLLLTPTEPGPSSAPATRSPAPPPPAAGDIRADPPESDGSAASVPTAGGARADGVSLPDRQWVSPVLAAVVAGAATAVWHRRSAAYRPQPPAGARRTDADLAPLPDVVTTIQYRLQAPPDAYDQDDPVICDGGPAPAKLGVPAGGVGLSGPGAADAARGLIAVALLGPPQPSSDAGDAGRHDRSGDPGAGASSCMSPGTLSMPSNGRAGGGGCPQTRAAERLARRPEPGPIHRANARA